MRKFIQESQKSMHCFFCYNDTCCYAIAEAYVSMIGLFCITYIGKKAPSQTFDWVLNTVLWTSVYPNSNLEKKVENVSFFALTF